MFLSLDEFAKKSSTDAMAREGGEIIKIVHMRRLEQDPIARLFKGQNLHRFITAKLPFVNA